MEIFTEAVALVVSSSMVIIPLFIMNFFFLQFGIVHTKNHQLYIEPSPRTHTHSHQHTITKSTLHPSQVSQPHQHQSTPHCSTTSEPTTTPSSQQGTGSRVRRLAGASDAYIEAVLVADSSVLGYHQQHDTEGGLEAYLFTLMHIVSNELYTVYNP